MIKPGRKIGPRLWKALNARLIVFGIYPVNMGEPVKIFKQSPDLGLLLEV